MKATRIFAAILIGLFLIGANAMTVKSEIPAKTPVSALKITYKVNVQMVNPISLCNDYFVVITNEWGTPVARPQYYSAHKTVYTFFEPGPAKGKRIATLTLNTVSDPTVCPFILRTTPYILKGNFHVGEVYQFYLFPKLDATSGD